MATQTPLEFPKGELLGPTARCLTLAREDYTFTGCKRRPCQSETKVAAYCRPPLPTLSSAHGVSQHTRDEGFSGFRSLSQQNRRFFSVETKGRADLKVVAVEENHLEAKVSNLTFDMAQAMTDVGTVASDVEDLQKEVTSLRTELNRLAGSVHMLRASGDRLDNHVSGALESYEKYHDKYTKPFFLLIILVLVLDLVLEAFILVEFLKSP